MTIGTPNEGIDKIPMIVNKYLQSIGRTIIKNFVFTPIEEKTIIQANYFKKSAFIAKLNNQQAKMEEHLKEQFRERMQLLSAFILVYFKRDEFVRPVNSQFFDLTCKEDEVVKLEGKPCVILDNERHLLREDPLGLKLLSDGQKLTILELNGAHLEWSQQDMNKMVYFLHHNHNHNE